MVGALIALTGGFANAAIITLSPDPADIWGLDHRYYYSWGISQPVYPGYDITSASLTFTNIYNTNVSDVNNILFVTLLDNLPLGTQIVGMDWQTLPNAFAGMGLDLMTWHDPDSGLPAHTFTYTFTPAQLAVLNTYWQNDGVFGFGFDPDCHFANDGIIFQYEIPVPEPTSLALIGLGLGAVAMRKRFFSC